MYVKEFHFWTEFIKVNDKTKEFHKVKEEEIKKELENKRLGALSFTSHSDDFDGINIQHTFDSVMMQTRLGDATEKQFVILLSEFASKSINFLSSIYKKSTNNTNTTNKDIFEFFVHHFDTPRKKMIWKFLVRLRNMHHHQTEIKDFHIYQEEFGEAHTVNAMMTELNIIFEKVHEKHGISKNDISFDNIPSII